VSTEAGNYGVHGSPPRNSDGVTFRVFSGVRGPCSVTAGKKALFVGTWRAASRMLDPYRRKITLELASVVPHKQHSKANVSEWGRTNTGRRKTSRPQIRSRSFSL